MVTLKTGKDTEKEYETLTDLINDNPDIKEAALIYYWPYKKSEAEWTEWVTFIYDYSEIDWEYSCVGERDRLIEFADNYGVWDGAEGLKIKEGGILVGKEYGYNPDNWTEDGTPDPRIRRGSIVSADGVKLSRIRLPSGREVDL